KPAVGLAPLALRPTLRLAVRACVGRLQTTRSRHARGSGMRPPRAAPQARCVYRQPRGVALMQARATRFLTGWRSAPAVLACLIAPFAQAGGDFVATGDMGAPRALYGVAPL